LCNEVSGSNFFARLNNCSDILVENIPEKETPWAPPYRRKENQISVQTYKTSCSLKTLSRPYSCDSSTWHLMSIFKCDLYCRNVRDYPSGLYHCPLDRRWRRQQNRSGHNNGEEDSPTLSGTEALWSGQFTV
jgi:hypothetical protein